MTDLFSHQPTPQPKLKRNAGYGNAMFLCDLAEGVSDATMRAKYLNSEYPHLHLASITGWRRMVGRTTKGAK